MYTDPHDRKRKQIPGPPICSAGPGFIISRFFFTKAKATTYGGGQKS
jgi:hypothetical protein